jgi:hypothetical protein
MQGIPDMSGATMTVREIHTHCARVYLNEARSRDPAQRSFCFVLLKWAANARCRAMRLPHQGELFRKSVKRVNECS